MRRVCRISLYCGALIVLAACSTVHTLQGSTLSQGQTSTDIVVQMVLDNLAVSYASEQKTLPWHIKITQGSVGVTDTINPTASVAWSPTTKTLQLNGSRAWPLPGPSCLN
jgi:hypothetical protein